MCHCNITFTVNESRICSSNFELLPFGQVIDFVKKNPGVEI